MNNKWKETPTSMWAWLFQRFTAMFAVALVAAHYFDPLNRRVQILLFGFVIFHALLGLRVILLDIGLNPRFHKVALWMLVSLGVFLIGGEIAWNR